MYIVRKSIFLLFCTFLCACISEQNICRREIDFTSANQIFYFNEKGNVVCKSLNDFLNSFNQVIKFQPRINSRLNENGKFEIYDSFENKIIHISDIGERILLINYDDKNYYFITNANSEYYRLEKFNLNKKEFEILCEEKCDLENIVSYRKQENVKIVLAEFSNGLKIYFDDKFIDAETCIKSIFNPYKILWREKSPTNDKWIISLIFKNRPPKEIIYDFGTKKIEKLYDSFEKWEESTIRKSIIFPLRDSKSTNAIITYSQKLKDIKHLPCVIFPHGGPGTKTELDFDMRAYFLAREGFLVVQPNYRGSTGKGKSFRFDGFGYDGIKKAQEDIEDCVEYLINQNFIDKDKIAILGGSWGAYCAAYAISISSIKQYYKTAILFFGAYDLPEMLKTFPEESKAHKALDELQFGILPKDEENLKAVSPIYSVKNIDVPILIYHFKNDNVIDFSQSDNFVKELIRNGKSFKFFTGSGTHGFESDKKEEEIYIEICDFLKEIFYKTK